MIVATVRALKMHGGVAKDDLGKEDLRGAAQGPRQPRPPCRERAQVRRAGGGRAQPLHHRHATPSTSWSGAICRDELGVEAIVCRHWADGSAGTDGAGRAGRELAAGEHPLAGAASAPLYPDDDAALGQDADDRHARSTAPTDIIADKPVRARFKELRGAGLRPFPICVAKTQYSFSTDPNLRARRPAMSCRSARSGLPAGAEFLVVICGEIMTMPGLPRVPAAESIRLDARGRGRRAVLSGYPETSGGDRLQSSSSATTGACVDSVGCFKVALA